MVIFAAGAGRSFFHRPRSGWEHVRDDAAGTALRKGPEGEEVVLPRTLDEANAVLAAEVLPLAAQRAALSFQK